MGLCNVGLYSIHCIRPFVIKPCSHCSMMELTQLNWTRTVYPNSYLYYLVYLPLVSLFTQNRKCLYRLASLLGGDDGSKSDHAECRHHCTAIRCRHFASRSAVECRTVVFLAFVQLLISHSILHCMSVNIAGVMRMVNRHAVNKHDLLCVFSVFTFYIVSLKRHPYCLNSSSKNESITLLWLQNKRVNSCSLSVY